MSASEGSPRSEGLSRTKRYTSSAVASMTNPTLPRLNRQPASVISAMSGAAAVSPPRLATDVQAPVRVPNSLLRNHCAMILAAPT
jgi:hypothetical protein